MADGFEEFFLERCGHESDPEIFKAVLFPWFVELLGIFTMFLVTRSPVNIAIPYTAIMFLEGILLGILYEQTNLLCTYQLGQSIYFWININSEALLLIFLPGLLFSDALYINYYLFKNSLGQTMFLAFPGMLFGTALTAVFSVFSFVQFNWGFPLALVLGSILSATDPVAVMELLKEVSAPPRLQMLISGESMLNDGSAIVFFGIFKELYFKDVGLEALEANSTDISDDQPGTGLDVSVPGGFKYFIKAAVGAVAAGIMFGGLSAFLIAKLNRRFEGTDTIMQVGLTITSAYITFYVSQIVFGVSGVIAVTFCGIMTSAFALHNINDRVALDRTWGIIDFLGNTLLFTLGGVVWGSLVADSSRNITGIHYAYLVALYLALLVIRALLMVVSWPVIRYTGLKTTFKEGIFMTWAGLRGTVGIALVLALDNEIKEKEEKFGENAVTTLAREQSTQVFFLMGGIALITLVFNAPTSEHMLVKLKLIPSEHDVDEPLEAMKEHIKQEVMRKYCTVTAKEEFSQVKFDVVQSYLSILQSVDEFEINAIKQNVRLVGGKHLVLENGELDLFDKSGEAADFPVKADQTKEIRRMLSNQSVSPADAELRRMISNQGQGRVNWAKTAGALNRAKSGMLSNPNIKGANNNDVDEDDEMYERRSSGAAKKNNKRASIVKWVQDAVDVKRRRSSVSTAIPRRLFDLEELRNLRLLFLDLLRSTYWDQIKRGYLFFDFVVYSLMQSIDLAKERVRKDLPLEDWECAMSVSRSVEAKIETVVYGLSRFSPRTKEQVEYQDLRVKVFQAISFREAHYQAMQEFNLNFHQDEAMSDKGHQVVRESQKQLRLCEEWLDGIPEEVKSSINSQLTAAILIKFQATCIEDLREQSLLSEKNGSKLAHSVSNEFKTLMQHARVASHTQLRKPSVGVAEKALNETI